MGLGSRCRTILFVNLSYSLLFDLGTSKIILLQSLALGSEQAVTCVHLLILCLVCKKINFTIVELTNFISCHLSPLLTLLYLIPLTTCNLVICKIFCEFFFGSRLIAKSMVWKRGREETCKSVQIIYISQRGR